MLDPRNEAQKVLKRLWCDSQFPVDPVTICKSLGLDVVEMALPDKVSGALIKEAGADPVIVLHQDDHLNRKRFSCAHELGHYISRIESDNTDKEYEYIDLRGPTASTGEDEEEVFANQFAANLLMPNEEVKKLHRKKMAHFEMALHFGVSVEALKYKLNALELL
ncbi:ImmA/IrrE family metallo-endopeptidase [Pseudoalteromonas rubra]|uniref:ImmA/IrrE family metallo-endopeptidase n=1 Tax=Pseudoalteromonas rubra TaxID=43658 RepID=UPI000F79E88E|nr:ImmA/IrrE family metallo-endopeptidase [Pseudoalteromonas rubra]